MDVADEGTPDGTGRLPDRRDVLKRGAVLGGVVVWATPVVQALSVRVADAASGGSAPPRSGPPPKQEPGRPPARTPKSVVPGPTKPERPQPPKNGK